MLNVTRNDHGFGDRDAMWGFLFCRCETKNILQHGYKGFWSYHDDTIIIEMIDDWECD